jgi:hypothetical protein
MKPIHQSIIDALLARARIAPEEYQNPRFITEIINLIETYYGEINEEDADEIWDYVGNLWEM